MKVIKSVATLQKYLSELNGTKSTGFVPTMGALHQGHLSIVKEARTNNSIVIVSIFVNPTQFNKKEDLRSYPITIEEDLKLLKEVNCDLVFIPDAEEIYLKNVKSERFDFNGLDQVMEGAFRKGHFDGVGTIVKKFFEIIKPDNAYFGEKDYQQLQIIKKMVEIENISVNIIPCKIYRENDGLAMSSRNVRLSTEQRRDAPVIYQTLLKSRELFYKYDINFVKNYVKNEFKSIPNLKLEYFEISEIQTLRSISVKNKEETYRAFIAVFAGDVRLIDNIALN